MRQMELGVEGTGNTYGNQENERIGSSQRNSNNVVQLNPRLKSRDEGSLGYLRSGMPDLGR